MNTTKFELVNGLGAIVITIGTIWATSLFVPVEPGLNMVILFTVVWIGLRMD